MMVTVAGAGAMGCRFGAALHEAGADVLLVDGWAGHVEAIHAGGLKVTDERGTRIVRVPARPFPAKGRADLVIIFAKATQTAQIARGCEDPFGADCMVLTLQNGLGNIEILRQHVPPE